MIVEKGQPIGSTMNILFLWKRGRNVHLRTLFQALTKLKLVHIANGYLVYHQEAESIVSECIFEKFGK